MDNDRREGPEPRTDAPGPKPYRAPVLTEYGTIARLTQSGGATQLEGASGRNMMG